VPIEILSAVDYTGLTSELGPLVAGLVTAAAVVITAALGWTGVVWGFPKLLGLFKKTAK
jgi:hypothetical protein